MKGTGEQTGRTGLEHLPWLGKLQSPSWSWERSSLQPVVGDRMEVQREAIGLSPHSKSTAKLKSE